MFSPNKKHYVSILSFVWILSACSDPAEKSEIQEGSKASGAIGKVVNLNQGWTVDTQQEFYFTSQGSRILPYDWYLNLEQADKQTLFRDDSFMASLRYLPA